LAGVPYKKGGVRAAMDYLEGQRVSASADMTARPGEPGGVRPEAVRA